MSRRTVSRVRSAFLPLSSLVLLVAGCGASVHSGNSISPTHQTSAHESRTIVFASAPNSESLALRTERTLSRAGETITLSLVNDSTITYGSVANCTTPTVVWLRGENGTTYFTTSGDADSCGKDPRALSPGQAAPVASVDSRMVWVDRTEDDKLIRLPQALPAGRYTVHALTSRGELVANLVLAN